MLTTSSGDVLRVQSAIGRTHRWLYAFAVLAFTISSAWGLTIGAGHLATLSFSRAESWEIARALASAASPLPFLLPSWRLWRLAGAFRRCVASPSTSTLVAALVAHRLFWGAMALASASAFLLFAVTWSSLRVSW
ncbi:MAG: hypothetical protein B7733_16035 [Myxococcales bacterium FL481]|nr:MAG: hypothetical protein B7733_16035 [Myxococcales bacterium FL481]